MQAWLLLGKRAEDMMRRLAAVERIGHLVLFLVVPLWIGAGAIAKLVLRDPTTLPKLIVDLFGQPGLGADLAMTLRFFVGFELAAIGIIWLVPRLARATAIFVLSAFIVTLLATIFVYGADACGCFGSVSPPPWVTIGIDSAMLAVVIFGCRGRAGASPPSWLQVQAALVWVVTCFFVVAIVPPRSRAAAAIPVAVATNPDGSASPAASGTDTGCGHPLVAPGDYWQPDLKAMVGQRWDQLDLASFVCEWPKDWQAGERFVLLYAEDCDHCRDILEAYFSSELEVVPGLTERTTLYRTPNPEGFPEPMFANPCLECGEFDLPVGPIWVYTTPLILRLQDGVVTCVSEGEDLDAPQCLNFF